jgi:hypothetical protein
MKRTAMERGLFLIERVRMCGGVACQLSDGTTPDAAPRPAAVMPGSFNPLHRGHRLLAEVAGRRLGSPVHFELSVSNVDKPDLGDDEVARRVTQFVGVAPVWVTRAATFAAKADLFPGTVFVLGHDTATRLIDPRYYGGEGGRDAALRTLLDRGCRVLVGGRVDVAGVFRVWDDLRPAYRELFDAIPEGEFRVDVSSTELRNR